MQLRITVTDQGAAIALKRLAASGADMKPAFTEIGEILRTSMEKNFRAGGRPTWKPSRRAEKEGGQTLRKTGILSNSFTVAVSERAVEVGTNVKYAATHQFGARRGVFGSLVAAVKAHSRKGHPVKAHARRVPIPWGDIPARPFMMVQPEDKPEVAAAIMAHLTRAINR